MTEGQNACSCVIDCNGLHDIASALSGNLKAFYLSQLASGKIAVPSRVWQEFGEVFEDEADELKQYIVRNIIMKHELFN